MSGELFMEVVIIRCDFQDSFLNCTKVTNQHLLMYLSVV